MKPTYRQIYTCVYRKGSTNFTTGQKELPENCKAKSCSGEFYSRQPKEFGCFIWNEDIVVWEKTVGNTVTKTEIKMKGVD